MTAKTAKTPNRPSYIKDLVLLFSIPAAIAVIAAVAVYAPRLMANPKYDFIYATCSDYDCKNSYSVDSAGYVSEKPDLNLNQPNSLTYTPYSQKATLRYYDVSTDSSRSITVDEAKKYWLSTSSKSPDGYTLQREETESGFLFWGDYDEGWYLKQGAKKQKVDLTQNDRYYSSDVTFLGWVSQ